MGTVNLAKLAGQVGALFLIFALALFLAAGTVAWLGGWVFLALFFGFVIALSLWLLRENPALLTERMNGATRGQQAQDTVVFLLLNVAFFAWLIVMPLDAVRFHWSHVPLWLHGAGVLLLLAAFVCFLLTFRENTYLSPSVRIQEERGQTVIATGPYHYVRHPMYFGFLLFAAGTPLLLGSWYGLLWSGLLVLMVARRAVQEEQLLRDELPGYKRYMTQVRYRFIPHVW